MKGYDVPGGVLDALYSPSSNPLHTSRSIISQQHLQML